MKRTLLGTSLLLGLVAPGAALATNGYFLHGYGVKAQGMAGVGIALPQDGLAGASNPAGVAFVADRADVGLSWMRPERGADISGNAFGLDGSKDGNGLEHFLIPELGYVKHLSPAFAAGLALFGNGGMNTDYDQNPFAALGATGQAGVDLKQLFIAPTLAYRFNADHAVGFGVNVAYQRFKAKGIQVFAGGGAFSDAPGNFSDQGTDSAWGWGLRFGYTGRITPTLTLGATYVTRTWMQEFDRYRGLFSEQGDFDVPESYGVGLAWQALPALTLAADLQRIELSDIKTVGTPLAPLFAGARFGADNGPGFGWRDVTVVKVGGSYELTPALTLRAGYSHCTQPIPESQTLLNIVAPGTIQHHVSLGASWKHGAHGELSFAYTHAFEETVEGSGSIPAAFGGGEADIRLSADILALAYGWRY